MAFYADALSGGRYKRHTGPDPEHEADVQIRTIIEVIEEDDKIWHLKRERDQAISELARRTEEIKEQYAQQYTEQARAYERDWRDRERALDAEHWKIRQALQEQIDEKYDIIRTKDLEIEKFKARIRDQDGLVEYFKRIARERSNSARGIPGKRVNPGYLLIKMQQIDRSGDSYDEQVTWQTVIQTYYPASLPFTSAEMQIKTEILQLILPDMSTAPIKDVCGKDLETVLQQKQKEPDYNYIYKVSFIASYHKGYWDVALYTTSPLTAPEYMLPTLSNARNDKNSKSNKEQ